MFVARYYPSLYSTIDKLFTTHLPPLWTHSLWLWTVRKSDAAVCRVCAKTVNKRLYSRLVLGASQFRRKLDAHKECRATYFRIARRYIETATGYQGILILQHHINYLTKLRCRTLDEIKIYNETVHRIKYCTERIETFLRTVISIPRHPHSRIIAEAKSKSTPDPNGEAVLNVSTREGLTMFKIIRQPIINIAGPDDVDLHRSLLYWLQDVESGIEHIRLNLHTKRYVRHKVTNPNICTTTAEYQIFKRYKQEYREFVKSEDCKYFKEDSKEIDYRVRLMGAILQRWRLSTSNIPLVIDKTVTSFKELTVKHCSVGTWDWLGTCFGYGIRKIHILTPNAIRVKRHRLRMLPLQFSDLNIPHFFPFISELTIPIEILSDNLEALCGLETLRIVKPRGDLIINDILPKLPSKLQTLILKAWAIFFLPERLSAHHSLALLVIFGEVVDETDHNFFPRATVMYNKFINANVKQ
jgi:hypothetical protein